MSTMLDIIGSMIIRGAIVLMTLYLSVGLQNAYTYKSTLYIVKQKTVVPAANSDRRYSARRVRANRND